MRLFGALAFAPSDPSRMCVGVDNVDLYCSQDGAKTWSLKGSFPFPDGIDSLAFDPSDANTILVAGYSGIRRSTDGGAHFGAADKGPNAIVLLLDPADPRTIWAVTAAGMYYHPGFYRSLDGGATWSITGLAGLYSWGAVLDPSTRGAVWEVGVGPEPIARSADGKTWTPEATGLTGFTAGAIAVDPKTPTTVWASLEEAGGASFSVVKSVDGAGTWKASGSWGSSYVSSFAIDPDDPTTVYGGSESVVFKTTDGGGSWAATSPLPSASKAFRPQAYSIAFTATKPRSLLVGSKVLLDEAKPGDNAAIFKSSDGGKTWTTSYVGNPGEGFEVLATGAPALVYGASGGQMVKSNDDGGSWSTPALPADCGGVASLAFDPAVSTTVYLGCSMGLYKSLDAGGTFTKVFTPSKTKSGNETCSIGVLAVDPARPSTVYAGTCNGVMKSTDGGAHWHAALADPVIGLNATPVTALAFDPSNTSTIYIGTSSAGIFKTTTGGD